MQRRPSHKEGRRCRMSTPAPTPAHPHGLFSRAGRAALGTVCPMSSSGAAVFDPSVLATGYAPAVVALFAAAGVLAAHLAARRSVRQPLPHDLSAEARVIALVAADPKLYARVALLEVEAFTSGEHRQLWAAFRQALAPFDPQEADADPDSYQPGCTVEQLQAALPPELRTALTAIVQKYPTDAEDAKASDNVTSGDVTSGDAVSEDVAGLRRSQVLACGQVVLSWWQDRQLYRGGADWQWVDDDGSPTDTQAAASGLQRTWRPPSPARQAGLALLGASAGAVALASSPHVAGQPLWWAHLLALLVLSVTAAVIASVDLDTLMIDLATVLWGVSAAAVPAAAVAVSRAGVAPLGWAGAVVAGLVLLLKLAEWSTLAVFALLTRLTALRRRFPGFDEYVRSRASLTTALGAGDLWLVPAAFGVPYLLFGSTALLVTMMLVACATAIVGHLLLRLRGGGRFAAFGPHLMWGWLGALLLWPLAGRVLFGV